MDEQGGFKREIKGWALLAVGALAVAGVLALLLAFSRTPHIQDMLPWDDGFFHRGLVTHVVFSFEIWFLAILGLLSAFVAKEQGKGPLLGWIGLILAAAGSLLLLVPTLANQGTASLNNYVPVLSHPLYYAGLALLAAGVALAVLRLGPPRLSDSLFAFGVKSAGLSYLAALLCFALSYALLPSGLDEAQFNERLFWAGGHVLQFVNTMMLMAAWLALTQSAFGRSPLPRPVAQAAFFALVLVSLAAIPLVLRHDILSLAHRQAFTDMLWFALPLPPLVMGAGVAWQLFNDKTDAAPPARLALWLSLAVFALGGVAGFFLGVADTRTPSHYHAVIGGVNLALMGLFHVLLLPAIGRPPRQGRVLRLQYQLYGGGQVLHALGFYLAGASGVPRKTAGAEQGLDSLLKLASMGVVGLGGLIAVIGGILFVWTTLSLLLRRSAVDE